VKKPGTCIQVRVKVADNPEARAAFWWGLRREVGEVSGYLIQDGDARAPLEIKSGRVEEGSSR